MITDKLGHGATTYKGESGLGKYGEVLDIKIIYTVVTRLELNRLKSEIENIDEFAFVIMSSIRDTKGGIVKKRPLNH
ncbi:MAG: YitT family protein [Ferruginibacter sp.]|nr:YitT family protein [Ferruginibacter sp.]